MTETMEDGSGGAVVVGWNCIECDAAKSTGWRVKGDALR